MDKPQSLEKKKIKNSPLLSTRMDDIFENFRHDIETIFSPWQTSIGDWRFPRFAFREYEDMDIRLPLCDLVDKGDKYEVSLEIPGIDKEKIKIDAKKNSVKVSGEQIEKSEEKIGNYIHNERSYKSFEREIPFPEEVMPSNAEAEMKNGVLHMTIAKKEPRKLEDTGSVNVNIK
jgi:HSP20 family protein